VITSSLVTVCKSNDLTKYHFTDADWSDLEVVLAYDKSKILAEKAAWEYVANLPDDMKFEVVTVLPGFVTGPNINTSKFSSGDIMRQFVDGSIPMYPSI
jgi:dihydroflavonol-4-reductase